MTQSINPASAFGKAVAFTLQAEGGFVNDPDDPGGATNFGITLEGLSEWRGHPCTVQDILGLTPDEAVAIYKARYWEVMEGDSLPPGLGLSVFDFGVNAGPGRSILLLQRMLAVPQDGKLGPRTLAAAGCSDAVLRSRITALANLHEAYYRSLPGFAHDGRGWTARVNACLTTSMAIAAGIPVGPAKPALPKPKLQQATYPAPGSSDQQSTTDLNDAEIASIQGASA